jgi:hypothetical protein
VRNETGADLVKHNAGTGNYKYFFPAGTDLVLKIMRSYSLNSALQQITLVLDWLRCCKYGRRQVRSLTPLSNEFKKGFGNINLSVDEAGDICGWSNDGTMRYPEAEWLAY